MKRLIVILVVFGAVTCGDRPPSFRVLKGLLASRRIEP